MDRVKTLEERIRNSVASGLGQGAVVQRKDAQRGQIVKLIETAMMLLQTPDCGASTELRALLLQVAKVNQTAAYLIRSLGFKTTTRFPQSFDDAIASRYVVLHFSAFLEDVTSALKKGNRENIVQGREDAWKSCVADLMQKYAQLPLLTELFEKDDVMDALASVGQLRTETSRFEEEARKSKKVAVETGRATHGEMRKQASALKRKLSELSTSGDSCAQAALDKIDTARAIMDKEDEAEKDKDPELKRKGKRTRGIRKRRRRTAKGATKPRYRRVSGDELRLLKKREIVSWYDPRQFSCKCQVKLVQYVNVNKLRNSLFVKQDQVRHSSFHKFKAQKMAQLTNKV